MSFRIVERVFSNVEECPSILIANVHGSPSVSSNMRKMEDIIQVAHRQGVNMVIFPELSITGYVWNSNPAGEVRDLLEEGENSRIAPWLRSIRDSLTEGTNGLEYVFYGNARRQGDHLYNSTFILNRGIDFEDETYCYDKVFLPPVELPFFRQGSDRRLSIDTKWGRFGFLICYDLCFVEMPRRYAFVDEVDAIITMAAWHSEAVREYAMMNVRTDHYYGYLWDLMNASKAAYNQIWSLGANWVGVHHETREYFWGGSGIWAPSGMQILQGSNIKEELLIVRNVNIRKQRERERDEFNYRIDFENFYRSLDHPDTCTEYIS